MHKLRLRTRSTAASKDSSDARNNETPSAGRPSTSTMNSSSSTTTRTSSENTKGKGKERSVFKASIRHMGGDSTRKGKGNPALQNSGRSPPQLPAATLRPQLELPKGDDFRTSLILPELTRRFTFLRGKDGSLVPLDQMRAHLRTQRENGRLTENEEEMVLRQYRLQSIYEAAQPDDNQYNTRTGGPSNIPYSPSAAMVALPEETASLYSSRAPSRAQMYTPEPPIAPYSNHSPSLSSPLTPYSPFSSMPSPQPMTTSSSSASSHTSTPTPVSGVGFASSSAAEFYAARDAVMRGNGLFGGGGLEREIHSTQIGMTPRKSRIKRYTTTTSTATGTSRNATSDSESQHSTSNDGHDAFSPKNVINIPPVPKIIKQQEEEYDPFRPRDSDDEGDDVQLLNTSAQSGYNASSDLSKNENEDIENEELVVPPHLDVPMSKNQFKRISRALQDIESELTKSYSFINMPSSSTNRHFSSTLEESNDDTQRQQTEQSQSHHQYEDYDLSPSDEEYNSSGFDHHHHNYFDDQHHRDPNSHERTFHSSTSGGSNSSEYHHQHSSKAPFVYDDTDEIDPPLNRLPSQHDLEQRKSDREEELGRSRDEYVDEPQEQKTTDHPRIEFDSEDRQEEEEQSAFESRMSSSTRQSDSTSVPTGRAASRAATNSTSTLDVIIDGKEDQYHHQQQDSRSLRPMYTGANARLSASSEISKPASSPGLPYLQATPPVQAFEFPSPSLTSSIESTNPVQQAHPPSTSSDSSESANMNASNAEHTISSGTTSHSIPPSASNLRQQVQLQSQQGPPRGNIPVSAIPVSRLLQTSSSPAHSRENSASSSIYNPPLSPPPQCGLPPLPSSASGHSLASIGQTSAHSKMPSMDSLTMLAQTASVQDEDKMMQEEQEKAEGRVPFPAYDRHEHNTSASPEAHSSPEEQERSYDNRHDSIQSSSADTDSRRYSNTSVGSSWRGGPSHGRSLSSSTVDFELSNLPLSPSKATHRMTNIEEDVDEDELTSSEIQEEERKKAMEYLRNHAPDLDMADLRDIHERLVQSALQQREDDTLVMLSAARDVGLEKRINGEPHEEQQAMPSSAFTSELFASEAMPLEKETLEQPAQLSAAGSGNVKLGSPFMEQNGFGEQREAAQDGHALATVTEEESEYSEPRESQSHPSYTEPASTEMQKSQSSHSLQKSIRGPSPFPSPADRSSPVVHGLGVTSSPLGHAYNGTPATASPRPPMSTATPPSTLRARPTRNSNSTPSMLIRHVHQQASEATAALKSPHVNPPMSPDEALWRVANNPNRRTLSHRRSTKNLKISGPQLVSSSANLENMPMIDPVGRNTRSSPSTSPEISRKSSVAGLKFKMRFKNRSGDGAEEEPYAPGSADSSNVSGHVNSPLAASASSKHMRQDSTDNSPSNGIRQLVARLRRRKVSNETPDKLIPNPLILSSPHWSSPKELQSPLSPNDPSLLGQFSRSMGQGPPSISSHGTDTMADTSPLKVADKSVSSDMLHALSEGSNTFDNLTPKIENKEGARESAASLDSMRKLFEAATALGLDADKVNELVDAAGYRKSLNPAGNRPGNQLVRSTVILAPTDDSYFPPIQQIPSSSYSQSNNATSSRSRSASSSSITRSRSLQSTRNRNASMSSVAMSTNGGSKSSYHDENGKVSESGGSDRKSIHDRPPTPPPDMKVHRRKKSDVLAAENPLPTSSGVPGVHLNGPLRQQEQFIRPIRPRQISNQSDDISNPTSTLRSVKDSRASYMSSKTSGSYDARSIYGLYGDEEEEIPPTPGIKDMNLILASGRIPGSSNQRASLLLAPGVSAKRLSTASRNSRIELSEYANGDIAFNIVQSLRRGPGVGEGERGTFYPMDLHRRQESENSIEEELESLVASNKASPEADPLKLLIKRHLKEQSKAAPSPDTAAALQTIAQLQALHPNRQRSMSAATRASSAKSVFEIYEAADENQVAALIEELTRGLDEGQFNLSRNDSISRAVAKKPQYGSTVKRTPSKIKRQPPPTI